MNGDFDLLSGQFLDGLDEDRRLRREGHLVPTPAQALAAAMPRESAPMPRTCDIWSVVSDNPRDLPLLVALTSVDRDGADAVLVIGEAWAAAGDDVIVIGCDSPTGTPLLLCGWRSMRISWAQLADYIGRVDESLMEIVTLLAHRRSLDVQLRAIAVRSLDDVGPVLEWRLLPGAGVPNGLTYFSGAPLVDPGDPRRRVRNALVEVSRYLPPVPDHVHANVPSAAPSVLDLAVKYLADLRISLGDLAWEPVAQRVSLGGPSPGATSVPQRAVKLFEQPFGSDAAIQSLTLTITQTGNDATVGVAVSVASSGLPIDEVVELCLVRTREGNAEPIHQQRLTLSGNHLSRRFTFAGISRKETWHITLVPDHAPGT